MPPRCVFSGERRRWRHRWRVLPSLVVLGLPLPLPRLSRRDRLKLGLALCSCYARAHVTCAVLIIMCKSPPSPRNIAQLLLLQVLALCRTKTLGNRSLQFSAPSTAAPPRGDTDAGSRTMGFSNHGALLRAAEDGARRTSSPSEWVASTLPFQGNRGWSLLRIASPP